MIDTPTLKLWDEWSRRDDWHLLFVGSDIRRMLGDISRLRAMVAGMIDNDPNELAADGGVTVLDVWRKDAARALDRNT